MIVQTSGIGLFGLLVLLAAPAHAIENCEMNLAVTTDTGAEAKIIGGPVADMCVIAMADGNMLPYRMSELTISTAEPAPRDVRSITPGPYVCRTVGDNTGTIQFQLEMGADSAYSVTDKAMKISGAGTWNVYDDLSIQFIGGPLDNSFVDAQNSAMQFAAWNDRPALYCKKAS